MDALLEYAAYAESPLEDVADAILLELLQPRRPAIPLAEHGYINLQSLDNRTFKLYFRIHKRDLTMLRHALKIPDIVRIPRVVELDGDEAFCILLRRLAYPNRLFDLERIFHRKASVVSRVVTHMLNDLLGKFQCLLKNLRSHRWLTEDTMQTYAQAIANKGAWIQNCWGFIDGTPRPICRPSVDQQEYYSGHKRVHCVKFQAVTCPSGMIVSCIGPYKGRRHDAGILRISDLYEQLQQVAVFEDRQYVIYGDPAYPSRALIKKPFMGARITPEQTAANKSMSSVRQGVEWGFGKVCSQFAFVDYRKNLKLMLQDVPAIYQVSTLLTNCHTCLYGNQISMYFGVQPPSLDDYLAGCAPM